MQETRNTARPDTSNQGNAVDMATRLSTLRSDLSPVANSAFNDNCNSIKILKRPSNVEKIDLVKGPDANQSNLCPQITLEDNTRTQYVPQVRILKRPNADKDKSGANDKSLNPSRSQMNSKTYQEREAEYAKARLRIMGSASAPEESNQNSSARGNPQTSNSYNTSPKWSSQTDAVNSRESNVPILRLPIGPDGTGGFNRELTSEQR